MNISVKNSDIQADFPTNQKFSGRQHFKSSPPSTTLTIFDNIDNFPMGLNNGGGGA